MPQQNRASTFLIHLTTVQSHAANTSGTNTEIETNYYLCEVIKGTCQYLREKVAEAPFKLNQSVNCKNLLPLPHYWEHRCRCQLPVQSSCLLSSARPVLALSGSAPLQDPSLIVSLLAFYSLGTDPFCLDSSLLFLAAVCLTICARLQQLNLGFTLFQGVFCVNGRWGS